jgi:hypothetical protein
MLVIVRTEMATATMARTYQQQTCVTLDGGPFGGANRLCANDYFSGLEIVDSSPI